MITKFLDDNNITYDANVLLSKKTWIKTGGICKFFIKPTNLKQLEDAARFFYQNGIPFVTIGATSNCFFTSQYSPIAAISTLNLNNITETDSHIISKRLCRERLRWFFWTCQPPRHCGCSHIWQCRMLWLQHVGLNRGGYNIDT